MVRGDDPRARKPAASHGHARTRRAGCSEAAESRFDLPHQGRRQIGRQTRVTIGHSPSGLSSCHIFIHLRRFAPIARLRVFGFIVPRHAGGSQVRTAVQPLPLLRRWRGQTPASAQTATKRANSSTLAPWSSRSPQPKACAAGRRRTARTAPCADVRPHARERRRQARAGPSTRATEAARTPLNSNVVATSASRLGLTVHETPASVDIVDQQKMQEQGYRTTTETAQGAVGVLSGDAAARPPTFSMRGFTGGEINMLYNGIWIGPQNITSRVMDTSSLERVEFLKGPSSLMSGLDAIGGSVNLRVASSRPRVRSRTNSTPRSIRSAPTARISAQAAARRFGARLPRRHRPVQNQQLHRRRLSRTSTTSRGN